MSAAIIAELRRHEAEARAEYLRWNLTAEPASKIQAATARLKEEWLTCERVANAREAGVPKP
jgi:hypothetical protein